MKKALALLVLAALLLSVLAACDSGGGRTEDLSFDNIKIAFIHIGDWADIGYTYRHHRGTLDMMEYLGISSDQVMNFFNISPGDEVDSSIDEAIKWGADMIFGTSFGFGPHLLEAAQKHPNVQFFHATGYLAVEVELPNFHNYFANISQALYLSGIAAGLRTETNVLGYVAARPYPEVITGYTAFYLGALSVNPNVTMYVMYTNYWNNPSRETHVAQTLIDRGADVLGQHADSTATQTTADRNGIWSVGYNNDMSTAAPNAVLVSPMFDWSVYLIYAVRTFVDGGIIPVDFLGNIQDGMVLISETNPATIAPGTDEAIDDAKAKIKDGWNIFTGPLFASDGTQILADGETWNEPISAPSWNFIIQGITIIE